MIRTITVPRISPPSSRRERRTSSLSTIYRNLEELERLGVVVHSHLGHGPATYHLAASAHCHFVCEHCGKAVKAPDELFANLADRAQKEFGFTIDPHHFSIFGRCRNCQ